MEIRSKSSNFVLSYDCLGYSRLLHLYVNFRMSLLISLSLGSRKWSRLKREVVVSRKLVLKLSSLVNLGKLSMLEGHVGESIENFDRWLVRIYFC